MPSKTRKERRTMATAAHDSTFAQSVRLPQKVAKEFNRADPRKNAQRRPQGRKR